MTEVTPLDRARAAMAAAPDDDAARLRWYEALAEAELVVLLAADPGDDPAAALEPALFDTEDGRIALAFEGERRLVAFTGTASPYAALPGRALVSMLAGSGLGLGVNLDDEDAAWLMPAEAVDWLAETLAAAPQVVDDRPARLGPPDLPEAALLALDRKLARAAGLAREAALARAEWEDGRRGHLLVLIDAAPGAETALATAAGEALTFAGLDEDEAATLLVAFAASGDSLAQRVAAAGLRFDLPEAETPRPARPAPPGSDPLRPPRLR